MRLRVARPVCASCVSVRACDAEPHRTVFVEERSGRASCVNVMRECAESVALFLHASTQRTFTSPGPWPLSIYCIKEFRTVYTLL